MNQRIFALALGALIVALCLPAQAQEEKKIPWIGYLAGAGSSPNQAFVQGMRDLGYVEGKNIAFVYRTTEGRRERYPDIVNELVRLKVNVLVTDVTSAAVALKKATNTIPIVMTSGTDPVETGLVASLARPRRERNGANKRWRRVRGKTFGVAERDHAEAHSCGHSGDVGERIGSG
jgi:putative tryptophan/tyrosine transport system substrate-binding protein